MSYIGVILDLTAKAELKHACKLHGGIKPLAVKLGIDAGNLNKWLNDKRSLPEHSVQKIIQELGLPNGQPDPTIVHSWKISRVFLNDLSKALDVYFPSGAKLALAPWVVQGISLKDTFAIGRGLDTLYGLTDDHVRAILRLPRALILHKENISDRIQWKNGSPEDSILDIDPTDTTWTINTPSISEFDRAWGGLSRTTTEADVIQEIRDCGVTFDEAIKAIRAIKKPRKKS